MTIYNSSPNLGKWYQSAELPELCKVVAKDDTQDTIEVQYLTGEIEEYDLESWQHLEAEEVSEPEDWSDAFEMNKEDLEEYRYDISNHPIDYNNPVDNIEPPDDDRFQGHIH